MHEQKCPIQKPHPCYCPDGVVVELCDFQAMTNVYTSSNPVFTASDAMKAPRVHAQGGKVIGRVVVMSTKIATSRDLGT